MAAIVTQEPGKILNLLNRALVAEGRDELATALIALLDRDGRTVRYASAGHPAPAAKPLHGEPFFLSLEPGPPLGANVDESYATHSAVLEGIALVVFYTDGLTELERDPIAGEIALKELLAGDEVLYASDASRFVMRLAAKKEALDDMAVMTVQIGETSDRWAFNVSDPAAAYAIKRDYVAALEQYGTADVAACEVIFGELIGNVLRYAPGRLGIGLSCDSEGVWLHVMDEGPGFEASADLPEDVWSESGRGLFLVHALARRAVIRRLHVNGSYVKVLLPVDVASELLLRQS
jgi:anti-sigma regulatory factor (Ser/Thr protein kinase)